MRRPAAQPGHALEREVVPEKKRRLQVERRQVGLGQRHKLFGESQPLGTGGAGLPAPDRRLWAVLHEEPALDATVGPRIVAALRGAALAAAE